MTKRKQKESINSIANLNMTKDRHKVYKVNFFNSSVN